MLLRVMQWAILCLLALGGSTAPLLVEARQAQAADVGAPRRVLILHSERLELPGIAVVDGSIRATLAGGLDGSIEVYSESLDVARFSGDSQRRLYRDFLRQRYADKLPDVIVTVGNAALDLLVQHRDTLFPDALVVASQAGLADQSRPPWVTGVVARFHMQPSFELILTLHPNTRRVVIVAGASPTDRLFAHRAQRELLEVATTLEVVDLGEATMAHILETVAALPSRTVIFYLHILRDAAGQMFVPKDALGRIATVANAPIYGRYDTFVGHGIVGGYVYSFEAHGAKLAEVALGILGGQRPPGAVPPVEAPADVYMFDWRQVHRWGIDERLLPAGSIVRFREPSTWQLYKWHIVGTCALLAVQSALIVGLLVNRTRRRRAEAEARRQREELARVLRATTLGELTASLAHEINQPLAAIVANAQAARRLVDVTSTPRGEIAEALTDIGADARRAARIVHRLSALFRKEPAVAVRVDINALIQEVVGLLHADLERRHIALRFALAGTLPPAFGDPVQLQQIVLNLVVNACEAIDGTRGGPREILITTSQPDPARLDIAVQDSGVGVKESELEHIFEHFVSTKPHGLGMGLAISRSIAQAHGGRIWATANADVGLTVHVELPLRRREHS